MDYFQTDADIEAFYDACEELRTTELFTPDAVMITALCEEHGIGYAMFGVL